MKSEIIGHKVHPSYTVLLGALLLELLLITWKLGKTLRDKIVVFDFGSVQVFKKACCCSSPYATLSDDFQLAVDKEIHDCSI